MVEITVTYDGSLRCTSVHGPSGSKLQTDAPKDNMGKGEAFSPTDLVATALATCVLTTMGIVAQRHQIDITGVTAKVGKEMSPASPRRIANLPMEITVPQKLTDEQKQRLTHAAEACPVKRSLHAEVQTPIVWHWE